MEQQENQEQEPMTMGKFLSLFILGGLIVFGLMSMCGVMSPLSGG